MSKNLSTWEKLQSHFPENGNKKGKVRGKKMLFNLEKDPLEKENVIKQFPEVAQKMEKDLNTIREAKSSRLLK